MHPAGVQPAHAALEERCPMRLGDGCVVEEGRVSRTALLGAEEPPVFETGLTTGPVDLPWVVELAGIEPATFSMPSRRSSQLSYSPKWSPQLDLNQCPHAYQACARSRLSYGEVVAGVAEVESTPRQFWRLLAIRWPSLPRCPDEGVRRHPRPVPSRRHGRDNPCGSKWRKTE